MDHIHLLVSTFDTSNVAVAHNLRSCSRPPSETKTNTRQAVTKTETKTREAKTKTSRVETKTKTKTSKSGLDRSRDQDQVSRPTSLKRTVVQNLCANYLQRQRGCWSGRTPYSRFTSMIYASHDMRQQCLIVILVYQVTVTHTTRIKLSRTHTSTKAAQQSHLTQSIPL